MQIANTISTSSFWRKLRVLGILLLGFSFAACNDYQEVTLSSVKNVKIINFTQKEVDAEITVVIKNPNNNSFNIYKSDFDLTINGINAGKAHLNAKIKIKSKSEETYTFRVKSDLSKLGISDLPKLIQIAMSKNVRIGLKGDLKAGKIFVKRSFPVDLNQNISL